ncbi:FAD-containing monooxygenase EthA [Aspergillus udagawae]|uniref:FAD-containing monooxygenase EthA n=1 Tax=Aspergillus udagawae TaxID=91492 RepID=A0A8H3PBA6_9EURO|nr:FAD-containing monooxygenase EthA [Aspergillus udagawae]
MRPSNNTQDIDYDVVIVGAGISGVNFAYRLQERNPNLTYCILEARHEIGGTWSLFQYPGIRSDSDLHTFGFEWRPWREKEIIAQGSMISNYIKESAEQEKIDRRIKFFHRVDRISWSTASKAWTLDITMNNPGSAKKVLRTRFIMLGTGYYDYKTPMHAEIPRIADFQGTVVHPQFWPKDLDYSGKDIVIIGSGATAVTLLPALAGKASHVTMLQRSPTYILPIPKENVIDRAIRFIFPRFLAFAMIRFKWILMSLLLVTYCQWFPNHARKSFLKKMKRELPQGMSLDPDFTPAYNPWDQRLCVCPDGDFYTCLRSGKGSVKTGIIDTVTKAAIRLKSGEELNPDIIVTATGLKMALAGGIEVIVDGEPYRVADHFMWKGAMLADLPNLVLAIGYVDASWTLGADATAQLACRLLNTMKRDSVSMIVPRCSDEEKKGMRETPSLYLRSTYVQRAKSVLPKTGDRPPWQRRSYYWKDMLTARWGDIWAGMEWSK